MEARFLLDLQLAWDLHQASHSPAGKNIRKIKRMTSTVGGNFHQAQFGHTMGGKGITFPCRLLQRMPFFPGRSLVRRIIPE